MQVQVVISMYHTQDYSIHLVLDYALISIFIPRPHIACGRDTVVVVLVS